MKNIETLLSLIATLLYWIFKSYTHWVAEKPSSRPRGTVAKTSPANPATLPKARQAPYLPDAQDAKQWRIPPSQATSNQQKRESVASARRQLAKTTKKGSISKKDPLKSKLAQYNSLYRAVIIHEILTPKHTF
jgi:hypothetical protein